MKVGLYVKESLKTILEEVSNFEYLDVREREENSEEIEVIVIDSSVEEIESEIEKFKRKNLRIVVLIGENEIYKMREFLLKGIVDDCIVRKDIFKIEESINILQGKPRDVTKFYLADTFKRGLYDFSEITYVTYSSLTRKSEFHLMNSEIFDIKKSFSEIEESLTKFDIFYKLDRSTIINLSLVEILDFKEELIIFKNREVVYISKVKLKELENHKFFLKDRVFLGV